MMEDYIVQAKIDASKPKKKRVHNFNAEKAKEQLRRLNVAYFAGNMTDEEYTEMAAKLKGEIQKAAQAQEEEKAPDFEKLEEFLASDFETVYKTLDKEDQRRMWRAIIKEIHVENNQVVGVIFNA